MFSIPTDFDFSFLVGQTLYAIFVQENLLRLDFGRTESLVNGKYADYARIEIEEGVLYQFGEQEERFTQNAGPRRLCEAAGILGELIAQQLQAVEVLENQELRFTFSKGAQITLLHDELESYHIHVSAGSFSV